MWWPIRNYCRRSCYGVTVISEVTIDSNTVMMTMLEAIWCPSIAQSILQTCLFSSIESKTQAIALPNALLDPQLYKIPQLYKTSLKCIKINHICINNPQAFKI